MSGLVRGRLICRPAPCQNVERSVVLPALQLSSGGAGGAKVALTLGAELLAEGAPVRHGAGQLLYRGLDAEQCAEQGDAGHCTDTFALELPCAAGDKQVRHPSWPMQF